ncbi:MAG: NADP-dependent malic enzyme [candidate division WOR-3 bacterium]|jgi:malate dehydrogenase (oxaloacetate-decarboxylating)|nr:NADP-dependent malic enzyme [candidate division WOR-3 bacterium]MCR4423093.1 NADP-dependent malic enzyme [candidate division WOR-3 bacterium]MDH7518432.1 NADP-dependent malic enzyme [bacterium]
MKKLSPVEIENLIAKAKKPAEDAMKLHPFYRGKIQIVPKCCVRDFNDFAIWYTPGVAAPCKAIQQDVNQSFIHTNRANTICVLTDGTRVLGLGDIGPEASMPVMEGKALLFKYLGGVDAVPIALRTKDPDEFIRTAKLLEPSFGGFNLEDIAQPKCFRILDTLRAELDVPVWHDDQQGTAAVTYAGLVNALKIVGKDIKKVKVAMLGAGASNIAIARVIIKGGVTPGNIIMCDSKGTLHKGRTELQEQFKEKWHMCQISNDENVRGTIADAMKGADVLIALSTPGPGVVKPEWIKAMAKDPIVFVCANPIPEIWPWEAIEAGARVVATGRSDFPNQVNNSLGFPGIFRGALDVNARTITDEMCIAAALELARVAEDRGLREDYLIPTMDDWEVFPREAVAVGMKAIEQGVARITMTREQLLKTATEKIKQAREMTQWLMKEGFILPAPA